MAAWADPVQQKVPRPKIKTTPHLRSLAEDLRLIAAEAAKKGA